MPKLTGIFSSFPDLEQIPLEDIARWLKPAPDLSIIENFIGNKILYPQTIPVSKFDLSLELAILREIVKRHKNLFFSNDRLIIPRPLFNRLPNLAALTLALVDVLLPKDVTTVELQGKIVGSVIRPECNLPGFEFTLVINQKTLTFKKGLVVLIPQTGKNTIGFKGQNSKLLGKDNVNFNVTGGALGLFIDGRAVS